MPGDPALVAFASRSLSESVDFGGCGGVELSGDRSADGSPDGDGYVTSESGKSFGSPEIVASIEVITKCLR